MQKLLVWLGTMIIVGSGIANSTANSNLLGSKDPIINNNLSTIQGIKTDVEEVNWKQVDEYFKDLHKQSLNKSSREKKMFELASDFCRKSVKKYQTMKVQSFSNLLDSMINDFRKEFPNFWNLYDKEVQKNNKGTKSFGSNSTVNPNEFINNTNFSNMNKDKQAALEYWDKLNNINTGFKTATAIVAIAAAGFWAAAWFFGISVPWAIAATVVAASLGVTTAGISYYLALHNEYADNIIKSINITLSIKTLAHSFWDIIFPILTANVTVASGTSVVMPAFTAILATTSAFYAWILGTNIFLEAENNEKNKLKIEEGKLNPKIDFKKIGFMSTGTTRDYFNIKLFKWTDYATSWEEFLKYYNYINLNNSTASAGGQGTTVERVNIGLSTKLISSARIDKNNYYSSSKNYFKQNLIRYEYRFIVAYQLSTIDMYLYRSGDEIHGFLNVVTQSANAVYRVWNSLKVASFDVTNKDFYDRSNRDNWWKEIIKGIIG